MALSTFKITYTAHVISVGLLQCCSRISPSGLEAPFCHLLAVETWMSSSVPLDLSLLINTMGITGPCTLCAQELSVHDD